MKTTYLIFIKFTGYIEWAIKSLNIKFQVILIFFIKSLNFGFSRP